MTPNGSEQGQTVEPGILANDESEGNDLKEMPTTNYILRRDDVVRSIPGIYS